MTYSERIAAMLETLLAHDDILVNEFYVPAPCKDADIEAVEAKLGRAVGDEILDFYREMNGFELMWFHKDLDPSKLQRFPQDDFGAARAAHYEERSGFASWRKRRGMKMNQLTFTRAEALASGTVNIRPLKEVFLGKNKWWNQMVRSHLKGVGKTQVEVGGAELDLNTLFKTALKPLDITHPVSQVVLFSPDEQPFRVKLLSDYFADATQGSVEVSFATYMDTLIAHLGHRGFERELFAGDTPAPLSLEG